MSHNILKLNTNSFDVNSNVSESINTTVDHAFVTPPTSAALWAAPTVGGDFLIQRGTVVNTFNTSTEFDFIDHASYSNYVRYMRFKADGVYKIIARGLLTQTANNTGSQGFYLHDGTNVVSSTSFRAYNNICYRRCNTIVGIVERSGTDIDISLRLYTGSNISSSDIISYRNSYLYVERLQ